MKKLLLALTLLPTVAFAQQVTPGASTVFGLALPGPRATGRNFSSTLTAGPAASAVTAANRLYAAPFFVSAGSTAKTLSFDITTGNASAWNGRMCIYADSGTGVPGSLMADSGTVAIGSGSVTGVQTATLSGGGTVLPGPGWYWLAFMADSASESVMSITNANAGILQTQLLGSDTPTNQFTNNTTGVFMAQTFGACPSAFGAVSYTQAGATPSVVVGF